MYLDSPRFNNFDGICHWQKNCLGTFSLPEPVPGSLPLVDICKLNFWVGFLASCVCSKSWDAHSQVISFLSRWTILGNTLLKYKPVKATGGKYYEWGEFGGAVSDKPVIYCVLMMTETLLTLHLVSVSKLVCCIICNLLQWLSEKTINLEE